jgi:carotenoid phi-ring synthase / carotenoid chi-ring synthase
MVARNEIIIIGAGAAGLTAALHLAERGLKPLVLEAEARFVGGRLAGGETVEVNGVTFRLEHGVHGIWSPYRNFQAMLARNNLRPVFIPAQEETWIYNHHGHIHRAEVGQAIRKSWIPAPLHYLQLFFSPRFLGMLDLRDWASLFNVWAGLVMGVGIDPFGENQPMEGMTLSSITKSWSPALKAFFLGLARNGLSAHPDEVPLSGFLAFLRFYTLLRRDSWNFTYLPDEGGTSITEPLAERIKTLGGAICPGKRVDRLTVGEAGWTVQSGDESFAARQVILAVESAAAQSIIKNSFEREGLFFPRSLSNAVVRLWFDAKPRRSAEAGIFTGDFILHNYFWLDRLYNPYRRWARETGGSCLEAHIYGPPEVLERLDAALLAQAIQDVMQAWPELRGHRSGQHLQRNAATHTLPEVGPLERHLGTVTLWEGLFCAGDWVRHTSPAFFLERACVTGISAANEVLKTRGLEPWPQLDYLPPEPFAAWIERLMRAGRIKQRTAKLAKTAKKNQ